MSLASIFQLSKWYLDCLTPEGILFIGYSSRLRIGNISLSHSSLITSEEMAPPEHSQTFLRGTSPFYEDNYLKWICPALNLCGSWEGIVPAVPPITQYTLNGKHSIWHCLQPRSLVKLKIGKSVYEGTGYAEKLDMSLPPWKLPISTLYWGRFHGEYGTTLTWILWEGGFPYILILMGNQILTPSLFNADKEGSFLSWDNHYTLQFNRRRIIRSGKIKDSELKKAPSLLKSLLPDSILQLEENKWLSDTMFLSPHGEEPGISIHEVVLFSPAIDS